MTPFELTQIAEARGWRVTEHTDLLFFLAPPETLDAPIDLEIMRRSSEILLPHIKAELRSRVEFLVSSFESTSEAYALMEHLSRDAKLRPIGQIKQIYAELVRHGVTIDVRFESGELVMRAETGANKDAAAQLFDQHLTDLHVGFLRASNGFMNMPSTLQTLRERLKLRESSAA